VKRTVLAHRADGVRVTAVVVKPKSSGFVRLRSADPSAMRMAPLSQASPLTCGRWLRDSGSVTATVARRGLWGKMVDDDLVCPPPVSASDHPARRLALCAFHAQLSRRRRSARGAWARCVLRNGATVGLEVRASIRPRIAPSTLTTNLAMASRRRCAAKAPTAMGVRSCIRDEGRPLEADRQG
jgi:hypothetical protein